ncbi:hypothetical protein V5O48_005429 [Marasmius crinis-equi]|uniref:F-box domain-containing protein n=1 Tax=Marasmius crinis-equi TaxID=585013 RepID=A0ABR3FM97_9AGAR
MIVQSTIGALSEQLKHHEAQAKHLKALLKDCRSLFTPFFRLPPEILTEIFIFAVDRNKFGRGKDSLSEAVHLASVCRLWREVALATPVIWAILSVEVELPFSLERLELHLRRSRGVLLTVEMDFTTPQKDLYHAGRKGEKIAQRIVEESHRWTSLKVSYEGPGYMNRPASNFMMRAMHRGMPALTSLQLQADMFLEEAGTFSTFMERLYTTTPNLRFTKFSNSYSLTTSRISQTNIAARITRLYVHIPYSEAVALLASCPQVQFAHLLLHYALRGSPSHDREPQLCPTLRSLTIQPTKHQTYPFYETALIFQRIICPSLTSLSLVTAGDTVSSPISWNQQTQRGPAPNPPPENFSLPACVQVFIRRSGATYRLEKLRVDRFPFNHDQLTQIMDSVPSLKKLEVHDGRNSSNSNLLVTNLLFNTLNYGIRRRDGTFFGVVPKLREIRFTARKDSWGFEEMLESRMGKAGLESVVLKLLTKSTNIRVDKLEKIKWAGLAVRVVEVDGKKQKEIVGHSILRWHDRAHVRSSWGRR